MTCLYAHTEPRSPLPGFINASQEADGVRISVRSPGHQYASDLLLTNEQATALANALLGKKDDVIIEAGPKPRQPR